MEGVVFLGLMKDVFQAVFVKIQFIQAGGLLVLVGLGGGVGQGPAQMLGMAGESRDGEPVSGRQGTQGYPGLESAVDLHEVGMGADGAANIYGASLAEEGAGGQHGGDGWDGWPGNGGRSVFNFRFSVFSGVVVPMSAVMQKMMGIIDRKHDQVARNADGVYSSCPGTRQAELVI